MNVKTFVLKKKDKLNAHTMAKMRLLTDSL